MVLIRKRIRKSRFVPPRLCCSMLMRLQNSWTITDVNDCLMNYWNAKLQDDVYVIKASGYEAGREIEYVDMHRRKQRMRVEILSQ